jgi:hypothetical protein
MPSRLPALVLAVPFVLPAAVRTPPAAPAQAAPALAAPAPDDAEDVVAAYHAAAAAGDSDALVALWRAHPGDVLATIDADLEQSLALRESAEHPDQADEAAIAALEKRAVFGARAATAATGHPIFVDYATAFTSWDGAQQARFRHGQGAFGSAMAALKSGDAAAAADAARRCLELAEPLGDWWGTAMGHTVLGRAQLAAGDAGAALLSHARARQIHHDLGLAGSEYGNLAGMIEAGEALGATARVVAWLRAAVALGGSLGDEAGVVRWTERLEALAGGAGASSATGAPAAR